ncbi:MAG TPA: UDP-2,3-diacylglucosamine diphosphatase LpxI [Pirellulales bacterium]|nr:UDP-2,3-diacylglucosamine diphosphatase LpxI [Pirellulales bacterium]
MSGAVLPFPLPRARIGLLAGWGRYPIVLSEALVRRGFEVYCLGVKDHADPALKTICHDFEWVGLAKLGRAIRYFTRHEIFDATMAGKIHKVKLLQHGAWLKHLPDWRTIKMFFPHFISARQDRKDDTLLTAIVEGFAEDQITFAPATDYAPELLVRYGQLTRRGPSRLQAKDIEFGWTLAKEMGRLDVGQSVAIKGRAAVAVEAIEGTDQCIRRAGELCRSGGFTVVKVAKPQQDMRFDVPTIGVSTLETMVAAGAKVLAVEAGRTIIVDEPQVLDFANRNGLILVALHADGVCAEDEAACATAES